MNKYLLIKRNYVILLHTNTLIRNRVLSLNDTWMPGNIGMWIPNNKTTHLIMTKHINDVTNVWCGCYGISSIFNSSGVILDGTAQVEGRDYGAPTFGLWMYFTHKMFKDASNSSSTLIPVIFVLIFLKRMFVQSNCLKSK